MRRLLILLGIAAAVVILLLIGIVVFLNPDKFRPRIQAELQSKLNRPVTLGQLHLRLFPLSIQVDGFTIAESPAFPSGRPFATGKGIYASASLGSLLRGQPEVHDVTLDSPQIELIQNASGVWNFSTLGNTSGSNSPSHSESGNLTLNRLKITDGQVAVTNQRTKSPRSVYNHIDLTATNFAPGKPIDLDAAVHFPGAGKELLSFRGTAGPLATGGAQATPINGQLSLEQVSLAGVNSFSPGSIPPNTDASMSGNATVTSENGATACKGTLNLDNAVFQGAKMAYPIETQYDLGFNQTTNQIAIRSGNVKMGPTAISIAGTVDSGATPANINLRLRTNNASIPEFVKLAGAFGGISPGSGQIKGMMSADLAAIGSIKNPQLQGTVSSPSIQAQEFVLTNLHATVRANNGVVELAPLTTGIFGGQEDGTITLDTKSARLLCSVNARLTNVDTNALLSAVSSVKNMLYGSLAAQANLNFALDSSANLASTLNGTLSLAISNGQLKNVNILNELSKVGKFLNAAPVQAAGGTALKKFAGNFNINQGVATTNNLAAELDQGSLSANGSLNLVNQGINMHMTAVLANSISQTVGGTSIGGIMSTALANNKGELVLPVIVTGTMAHPVFSPDMQAIANMKMKNLLPNTQNPSSLVQSLLGTTPSQKPGQKNPQPNPLNSIFDALKKH